MPVVNHIHTYVRSKSRPNFYMCVARDCNHIIEKEFILGKLSLCTECHSEMTLTREDLRRVRPKCLNCSNTKEGIAHRKGQAVARYLGTDSFNPQATLSTLAKELKPWPEEEPWEEIEEKEESEQSNGGDRD